MKWKHPLKGRTVKETIGDVFNCQSDSDVWQNKGHLANVAGGCRWGVDNVGREYREFAPVKNTFDYRNSGLHSWCTMKDCLKYGFDICEDTGEITSNNGDN